MDAATFLAELEGKNHDSFKSLAASYVQTLAKEGFQIADMLRLEAKTVLEAIEMAALWLPDAEPLELKLALAARCGDGARQLAALTERLAGLGIPPEGFEPRHGGYSKLFAFFRSLQTTEERAAAGFLTLGSINVPRLEALAVLCQERGDPETAAFYQGQLLEDERRHVTEGRRILVSVVTTEESQARAKRAAYRTLELQGEVQDAGLMRKFLKQSLRR